MLRAATLVVALAAAACAGHTDDKDEVALVVTHDLVSLAVCGRVLSFEPPTSTADGTLALDSRTWGIAVSTSLDGAALLVPGDAVCVRAELDSKRRIVAAAITSAPDDPWTAAGLQ